MTRASLQEGEPWGGGRTRAEEMRERGRGESLGICKACLSASSSRPTVSSTGGSWNTTSARGRVWARLNLH